jgi:hypothetical protein
MSRKRVGRLGVLGVLAVVAAIVFALLPGAATSDQGRPGNNVLARQLAVERGQVKPHKSQMAVSGGVMNAVHALTGEPGGSAAAMRRWNRLNAGQQAGPVPVPPSRFTQTYGCPNVFPGRFANIRVNQDCTLRRQAEEWVGVNPRDFDNVLAGQNDSMVGFNHCGYDWSLDRGERWGSVGTQPPPFYQELFLTGDTADACSDPSGTFDHLGNAYVTGVFFDVADFESSIWVAKSNYPINGRYYHEPREIPFQEYRTAVMGEPASDADPDIFHDKELMQADSRDTSSKKGRVYVTWTRFETNATPVGGRSPIVFSQSTDGGATWSPQVIISGAAGAFCTHFGGTPDNPNACDQDQGSHPVVGPDGWIYVIFGNGNTPEAGVNQVLMVRCPATEDCNDESDWQGPFRVGDLIGTHPIGDPGNAGGCPVGRQCLPPNGYRAPEFTGMTISVDRNSNLYATWWDTRNLGPPCGPLILWSAARPPCNSDVFYSFSTNRGTTWSPARNVTGAFSPTAQWQSWSDVSGDGNRLYVAYYDRHYGNCEFTGCNDITLTTVTNPRSANPSFDHDRITTGSMPNLVPANNPIQAGFLGDYMWVEASRHDFDQRDVHIVWADTRPLFGTAPEEDIYYARVNQPR